MKPIYSGKRFHKFQEVGDGIAKLRSLLPVPLSRAVSKHYGQISLAASASGDGRHRAEQSGAQAYLVAGVPQESLVVLRCSSGAIRLAGQHAVRRNPMKVSHSFLVGFLLLLLCAPPSRAQTATVDWTNVHQVVDGFGAADAQTGASMSSANQNFFFGTGTGQLGLSLLRVGVTNGSGDPGSCSRISTSCAGVYVSDMQAVLANGGRVYASPWSPPAAFETNGSTDCSAGAGNGQLSTSEYGAYATWLSNFAQSLKADNITLDAISVQNEPANCQSYDSAIWSASQLDTFVKVSLGPTFLSSGLSTLIFMPETPVYSDLSSYGGACMTDSSCNRYVGGANWHDYDASLSGNTVTADPYPSGWPAGIKYWETEASCGPGYGPNQCQSGFNTNITDALMWAAIVDQRIAVDGANAWLYWWLIDENNIDDEGLMSANGTIAQRAYMLAQYARFIRPRYNRIEATHEPQAGVTVSAYRSISGGNLVIVATNYTSSAILQYFRLTNAPNFNVFTPYITSSSLSIAPQATVAVSSNSFTYSLPAQSITSFVGNTTTLSASPVPPTELTTKVN